MQIQLQVFIEKTQHIILLYVSAVSLQAFRQLEKLSEQRRKSKL